MLGAEIMFFAAFGVEQASVHAAKLYLALIFGEWLIGPGAVLKL